MIVARRVHLRPLKQARSDPKTGIIRAGGSTPRKRYNNALRFEYERLIPRCELLDYQNSRQSGAIGPQPIGTNMSTTFVA